LKAINKGFRPQRYEGSAHQTLVPVQTFRTLDGFITVFCGKESFWQELCKGLGASELAADTRFLTFEGRLKHRDRVTTIVQGYFSTRSTEEWLAILQGKVPCAPVLSVSEALDLPGLAESGTIIAVNHPQFGLIREVNTPVRFEGRRGQHNCAPQLGQDTDSVLREYLSYSEKKIATLRDAEVV
jgi:crotonobetainyl-CoA:carnitine CoA-transferase CaiB-like acyl-CoA transferase